MIAFLRDGERDRFLAIFGYMKRSIALLAWKGRSLFLQIARSLDIESTFP